MFELIKFNVINYSPSNRFGTSATSDSVVRSVHYKYLHPKEVFVADGVLVPDLIRKKVCTSLFITDKVGLIVVDVQGSSALGGAKPSKGDSKAKHGAKDNFSFVFPYGVTLNVHKPSRALLSSGSSSYPINRPVCSIWESETVGELGGKRGRLVVLGSTEIFADEWIDKEENGKLCDLVLGWLLDLTELDMISERKDDNMADFVPVSSVESLSQTIKPCLQAMDALSVDFTRLFDMQLHRFDTLGVSGVAQLYRALDVPHQTLTLITPQFECPLPKTFPATFPPTMKELPPPALDLFDLDDTFALDEIRLAQLANKCSGGADDLDYFISESANVLKVLPLLAENERSAKHVLFHIFRSVVDYKRGNGGGGSGMGFS